MKNTIHIFGWLFITAGTLGLFLPFVQGIVLIAFGIAFLSFKSPNAQRKIEFFQKLLAHYWPAAARFLAVLEEKCDIVFTRIRRWRKRK
ncbi:MAG: hypothetical protein G01um101417_12 [Parcubacteria group bacterium Gr01-1014_17]|nr:MAG: hypothetical protein G01um101417_12 [Parcubacteria group bacterium Gr01-1014_17]